MSIEIVNEDRTQLKRIMASGFAKSLGEAHEIIGHFLGMIEESSATLVELERSKDGWFWFVVEVRKLA